MENNIVNDFQNLRVFSNRNINRMDELVQDLNNALEETSKSCIRSNGCQENTISAGAVARRYHKRRRGARRASNSIYGKRGTISEASESSIDEVIRDYIDNSVVTHSDSDDLSLIYPKQRLTVPISEPVPPVESDSFTENLSPMRPQRRRRRYKHMAVDSFSRPEAVGGNGLNRRGTPTSASSTSCVMGHRQASHHVHAGQAGSRGSIHNFIPGKRKRSSKSRSEGMTNDQKHNDDKDSVDLDNMDVASISQESSSLSSSEFDSDVYNNADEGREADDEQSDFFHEPDPDIPWWEREGLLDGNIAAGQQEFDTLLSGALSHMSVTSQRNFRQRVDKMIARAESGREIRIGRRKLKGNLPRYTMIRFLQDRERWNSMQIVGATGGHYSPGANWNSGCSSQSGDYKRLRQTPPPLLEGFVGIDALPIPETNIGNQMLQSMGWIPGSGLGAGGDGRQDPVVAYRRCDRKGLGYETQSDT